MPAKKMDGFSLDVKQQLVEILQKETPQIFTEGKIDPAKLMAALGQEVSGDKERYGLSWAGKNDCFRHIQEPTTATLKPCRKESTDFDTTENLFIEGDNLQVLKVLQKSYYGKVKMIYIDPPYNTGNDSFIYPDKFSETQDEYLKRVGDKDAEGNLIRDGFWRKNSKDAGHFHSNWLSMMYPRLFLARNLLRQDGVIFVSIDDNEVHNLRMIMNEIFGDENFLATIIWQKVYSPRMDTEGFSEYHDYILVYRKTEEALPNKQTFEQNKEQFKFFDKGKNKYYRRRSLRKEGKNSLRSDAPSSYFALKAPDGRAVFPIKPDGTEGCWRWSLKSYELGTKEGSIEWVKTDEKWEVYVKQYYEGQATMPPVTLWTHEDAGHNHEANDEIRELLNSRLFDSPKPTRLIKKILQTASEKKSIILDFFAGSCTTAHAVMQLNAEDGGNRKYICVQLPEPCEKDSEAAKAGFATIADIGKERIRRAAKKIKKEADEFIKSHEANPKLFEDENLKSKISNLKSIDLGFKVFKLEESNFKEWRSTIKTPEDLKKQMELFVNNVKDGTNPEDILYELILKSGLDLNVPVEAKKANGKNYYKLDGGKLIVCLEEKITQGLVDKILAEKPEKCICLDRAFAGNDQLKTNTALQMEAEKVEFKVI